MKYCLFFPADGIYLCHKDKLLQEDTTMKKRLLAVLLILAVMIPMMSFGASAAGAPSKADLDAINATCAYPKDEDYLSEYKTQYINGCYAGGKVWALSSLVLGNSWRSFATQLDDLTEVTVIAEHRYTQQHKEYCYSCCIFEDKDGNKKAGWINTAYLWDHNDNALNPSSIIGTWYKQKADGSFDKDNSLVFDVDGTITVTRGGKMTQWTWGTWMHELVTFNWAGRCVDDFYVYDGYLVINKNGPATNGSFGENQIYKKDLG